MADGAAESTKELTEEGAKVTTVAEGTDATAAPPAEPVASPPESVAIFFDGEPMAGKAETWMTEHVADTATLQFVGPHALPLPLFDKAGFGSKMSDLVTSFPDLTFNSTKVAPSKQEDGSWAADIVVTGTHTGAAFTPMADKLPAIETTGTAVSIGPETFTVWADEAGKVVKIEIMPKEAGNPHGPPGFYLGIGGDISALAPPAADADAAAPAEAAAA